VPGWEDSTLGNVFAAHAIGGRFQSVQTMKSGIEYMIALAQWYRRLSASASIGFFQIGGGIAGDFSDLRGSDACTRILRLPDVPLWGYFCQISDSTTSYGSYSGAVPTKRSRGASSARTRRSSSSSRTRPIVAPLLFAKVLGW